MARAKNGTGKGHSQLRGGRRSLTNQIYHVSSATADRRTFFRDFECGRIVVDAMRQEHEAGHVSSLAFVVMPDHLHWLFSLTGSRALSVSVNTVKSVSARRINNHLNRRGQLWGSGFYERAIRREDDLVGVARYIIANPVRAGVIESVRDYPLWDAIWL